jgi:hypothetical protein
MRLDVNFWCVLPAFALCVLFAEFLQVAAGACVLQLQLPNRLLADMTERATMLQASQQADPYDVQLLQAAMDKLARVAVAATV